MRRADVLVVGAGPAGLFQVFELGLLGLNAVVVEALERPGGQCVELYPDKPIFDIPAIPEISGGELAARLLKQIEPFDTEFRFGDAVSRLEPAGERFHVVTDAGAAFDVGAVVIAAGAGVFRPVRMRLEGIDRFEGRQLHYAVRDRRALKGQRVVIFGGGDSALDWALTLASEVRSLALVHRSDRFRAQPSQVARMQALCAEGRMECVLGKAADYRTLDDRLVAVQVALADGGERWLAFDQLLVFFGMVPNPGPLAEWGLEMERHRIRVDTQAFETSVPGIFAVGDINVYPGKQKLILSGFHEAALAAFAIKQRLEPGKKVQLQYTTTSPQLLRRLGRLDESDA
ncbi:NAD(P)/FAD-dependent oxidoreductase [Marinobacterium aestuariivivens]|uniref:Ferredoxin--NADP reductase n=1 Tax=Marinobacterium aestuariivivens TaxID=1698799 RepID=A0ABW2A8Q3_9GAMM